MLFPQHRPGSRRNLYKSVFFLRKFFPASVSIYGFSGGLIVGGAASAVASEKLRFATISEEDVRKGMVSREGGEEEFDILEMWSRLEKDFPVHYIIARSALSACETEAHEERVFSFMKHVLGDLRQSMDCEMLEMWVDWWS